MTELDGKRQRQALTAAERAIEALAAGQADRAARSAQKAADLDQLGVFVSLPIAISAGVSEIEAGGGVSAESWDLLEDAVGPGPLQFLIREARSK